MVLCIQVGDGRTEVLDYDAIVHACLSEVLNRCLWREGEKPFYNFQQKDLTTFAAHVKYLREHDSDHVPWGTMHLIATQTGAIIRSLTTYTAPTPEFKGLKHLLGNLILAIQRRERSHA